jgi:hypothetical protein
MQAIGPLLEYLPLAERSTLWRGELPLKPRGIFWFVLCGLLGALVASTPSALANPSGTLSTQPSPLPALPVLPVHPVDAASDVQQQVEDLRQLRARRRPAQRPRRPVHPVHSTASPRLEAPRPARAPAPRHATWYIAASAYTSHGKRYSVRRIEVAEQDHGKQWSRSWDRHDSKRELACRDATVGKRYTIKIEWVAKEGRSERNTWTRTFSSSGQTESFWHP